MNRFKSRFSLPIVLALLLLMLSNASLYAQGPGVQVGDKTVFGGSYVLASGERLKGSLTVFGGTAQIEQDATVEGDVAIMGGSAVVDGRITGDVAVFGGRLRLGPSAVIEGDLAAFGAVDRAPGARVLGSETSPNFRFALPGFGPGGPPPVVVGREGPGNFLLRLIWGLVKLVLTTIALGALGLIVALFLPRHTRNVAATASSAPAASAGVGCLTVPAAIAVSIILVITLIGIPVALVLWIVLVVAALFGWVGLGLFIGDRLLRMADVRSPRAAAAAAIGTALLTLVNNIFGFIPCIGGL
ncbi:MAG: polymer-forming cytoskeletal protein [Ardenticatenaceae bacterium]|nr:polymer-forming cytoskeletal protein [Ardenticatenaceae bacterium]